MTGEFVVERSRLILNSLQPATPTEGKSTIIQAVNSFRTLYNYSMFLNYLLLVQCHKKGKNKPLTSNTMHLHQCLLCCVKLQSGLGMQVHCIEGLSLVSVLLWQS